jgi:hypothetical protein
MLCTVISLSDMKLSSESRRLHIHEAVEEFRFPVSVTSLDPVIRIRLCYPMVFCCQQGHVLSLLELLSVIDLLWLMLFLWLVIFLSSTTFLLLLIFLLSKILLSLVNVLFSYCCFRYERHAGVRYH